MIWIGVFVYFVIGSLVSAITTGRSVLDIVLDILLWPVIVYYFVRYRWVGKK